LELDNFKCKKCGWTGNSDELNWDTVETCMGEDKIEICPECGSMEVFPDYSAKIPKTVCNSEN